MSKTEGAAKIVARATKPPFSICFMQLDSTPMGAAGDHPRKDGRLTCGIYARVSTQRQETENQLRQMRTFAASQGWAGFRDTETPPREFIDHESGKTAAQRPRFVALMEAATRREIDVVLFWSLDRFSREGALATLQHLDRLSSYGVGFRSFTEPYLDSCGMFKDAVIAILGTIAKQERVRLSERVTAGLERAREGGTRSGKAIGRPRRVFDKEAAAARRRAGESYPQIARALGVGQGTVVRALKDFRLSSRQGQRD
jgi:DNA invertase Pin-like site-specific DNA recombinase